MTPRPTQVPITILKSLTYSKLRFLPIPFSVHSFASIRRFSSTSLFRIEALYLCSSFGKLFLSSTALLTNRSIFVQMSGFIFTNLLATTLAAVFDCVAIKMRASSTCVYICKISSTRVDVFPVPGGPKMT